MITLFEKLHQPVFVVQDKELMEKQQEQECKLMVEQYLAKFTNSLYEALREDEELKDYFTYQNSNPFTTKSYPREGSIECMYRGLYYNKLLKSNQFFNLRLVEELVDGLLKNKDIIYDKAKKILLEANNQVFSKHKEVLEQVVAQSRIKYLNNNEILDKNCSMEVKIKYHPNDTFSFILLAKGVPFHKDVYTFIDESLNAKNSSLKEEHKLYDLTYLLNRTIEAFLNTIKAESFKLLVQNINGISQRDNVYYKDVLGIQIKSEKFTKQPTIYLPLKPTLEQYKMVENLLKAIKHLDDKERFVLNSLMKFQFDKHIKNPIYTNSELKLPYDLSVDMIKELEKKFKRFSAELSVIEFLENEEDIINLSTRIVSNESINLFLTRKSSYGVANNGIVNIYHYRNATAKTKKLYFENGKRISYNRFVKLMRKHHK